MSRLASRGAETLLALLLVVVAGCDGEPTIEGDPPLAQPPVEPAREVRVLGQLPTFELTDQTDAPFRMARPSGQIWVANFIFTRCAGTCVIQSTKLRAAQDQWTDQRWARAMRFLSFTVDPEHDTPEVLSSYAEKYGADPERWTFLTGDRDAIWSISKDALHLDVRDDADQKDMPIFHSTKMVLIDSLGRIRGYYDGTTDEGLAELERDARVVTAEPRNLGPQVGAVDVPWLAGRAAAQIASAKDLDVFHDFRFEDRADESGITFVHGSTPDANIYMKPVHYDHGNGLPSADVDGDGRFDLLFLNQIGRNELWRNLGDGTFEDMTDHAGIALDDRVCITGTFCDIDNDGDPDLYITSVRAGNVLYENDGTGKFTDVTEGSGLGVSAHSSMPVFFDYDRDGLTDVFLTNVGKYTSDETAPAGPRPDGGEYEYWVGYQDAFAGHMKPYRTERSQLFRNVDGRRFEDVTKKVGLIEESWTGDASPIDVNNDGWLDLYVLDMQGHDDYYENVEGKRFVQKSRDVFPRTAWGAMGIKVFDFENDGDFDIYITDMHSDMAKNIGPDEEKLKSAAMHDRPESIMRSGGMSIFGNAFFRNDGDGKYTEVSDEIGAENYWPWGLTIADLNADGWQDAFITSSMGLTFRYAVNSLLLNERGERFFDSEFILGVEPRKDGRTAKPWFEFNVDGDVVDSAANRIPNMFGEVVTWDALATRTSVIFDLDDDGDLDIVTSEWASGPMVLISNLAAKKKDLTYLKVRLVGTRSNRDGLGAIVRVHSAENTYTQRHDGKSGYLSQGLLPLYFGLGGQTRIDRVEVTWPSGTTQTVTEGLEPNQTLTITETDP